MRQIYVLVWLNKQKGSMMPKQYVTCAMYKFVALPHFESLRAPLLEAMNNNQIFGTLLLAAEGINGTVSGTREGIDNLLAWIMSLFFADELSSINQILKTATVAIIQN